MKVWAKGKSPEPRANGIRHQHPAPRARRQQAGKKEKQLG
jgi:hypothetical protein